MDVTRQPREKSATPAVPKGSKFTESLKAAIAEGKREVDLGPCHYNQHCLVTVAGTEQKVVILEGGFALSSRIKALVPLLKDGQYQIKQNEGVLSW